MRVDCTFLHYTSCNCTVFAPIYKPDSNSLHTIQSNEDLIRDLGISLD